MAENWNESVPADSRNPILGDDDIRSFKIAVREIMDDEHQFPTSGQDTDAQSWRHKQVVLAQTTSGSEPSTAADEVSIFQKDDAGGDPELFMRGQSDGTIVQVTDESATKLLGSIIKNFTVSAGQLNTDSVTTAKITDANVTLAKLAADAQFAAGTKMLFGQASAPTGWTKDTTSWTDNAMIVFTTGSLGSGGSDNPVSWTTAVATQNESSHTHGSGTLATGSSASTIGTELGTSSASAIGHTHNIDSGNTGTGSAHNHAITQDTFEPKYQQVIAATKD